MAYPGLSYIDDSPRAKEWSERFAKPMHEVNIATEAFELRIVFHDFSVTKLNDTMRVVDTVIIPLEPQGDDEAGELYWAAPSAWR